MAAATESVPRAAGDASLAADPAVADAVADGSVPGPAAADASPGESATDAFEDPSFDLLDYLNKMFPTEASLSSLPEVMDALRSRIARTDAEILRTVRKQSRTGARARAELAEASAAADELFGRLAGVRERASEAEALVRAVSRDVRALDAAKHNLTEAVSDLRRLGALLGALSALQSAADGGRLAEAARLLGAVRALGERFFDRYAHVPRVAEARGTASGLEAGLRAAALREVRRLAGADARPSSDDLSTLSDACALADALGPSAREEAVEMIVRRDMGAYAAIFGAAGDTARLERTVNRYKWFLGRLDARGRLWEAFPKAWRVPQLVSLSFCNVTKAALAQVLDARAADLTRGADGAVEALVKAVEATNIFEAELDRRFPPDDDQGEGNGGHGGDASERDPRGADAVGREGSGAGRRPHAPRFASSSTAAASSTASSSSSSSSSSSLLPSSASISPRSRALYRASFRGAISPVFEDYLPAYVASVERDLRLALSRMLAAETWRPLAPGAPVLASAGELTDAIRAELRDCAARVTRGPGLVALAGAFGTVLEECAARLAGRLPRPAQGPPSQPAPLGASNWLVRATDDDERAACLVAGTARHLAGAVGELARAVDARVRPDELRGRSENAAAVEALRAAETAALCTLALSARSRAEPGLLAVARQDHSGDEPPNDASPGAAAAAAALRGFGARVAELLDPPSLRFVLDRVADSLCAALAEAVARCRRVSPCGCQQLRLDLDLLGSAPADLAKEAGLPDAEVDEIAAEAAAALAHTETALKVAGAPLAAAAETYASLAPGGSRAQLARILEMRDLKRTELATALEAYDRENGGGRGAETAGTESGAEERREGAGRDPARVPGPRNGLGPANGPNAPNQRPSAAAAAAPSPASAASPPSPASSLSSLLPPSMRTAASPGGPTGLSPTNPQAPPPRSQPPGQPSGQASGQASGLSTPTRGVSHASSAASLAASRPASAFGRPSDAPTGAAASAPASGGFHAPSASQIASGFAAWTAGGARAAGRAQSAATLGGTDAAEATMPGASPPSGGGGGFASALFHGQPPSGGASGGQGGGVAGSPSGAGAPGAYGVSNHASVSGQASFTAGGHVPPRTASDAAARAAEVAAAARQRLGLSAQAARASASAAGDSVRETMGRTLGAMRNFRFMNAKE